MSKYKYLKNTILGTKMQKFEETVTPFIDAGHLLEDSVIAPLAIVSDQESLTCSRRPGTELNLKKFVN